MSALADVDCEVELVRVLLVVSGSLLFAGGMLALLTSESIATEHGWDLTEQSVWSILLISIIPGIALVFAGIMLETPRKYAALDFIILACSIIALFLLTMVGLVVVM